MVENSIPTLASKVSQLHLTTSRVIVAIDGRGGAGKSSLARALQALLPKSAHIEFDWFHLPQSELVGANRYDHERLISELINPFSSGASAINFRRYNWGYLAGTLDGFHETPVVVQDKEILIIEGCRTFAPALLSHYHLKIWVDTPPDVATARGIRRDIEEYKLDPTRVRECWQEWRSWEDSELAAHNRRLFAEISFVDN